MFGAAGLQAPRGCARLLVTGCSKSSAWRTSPGKTAGTLTLSGQKRLELARAVATGAQLVLLDEVMAGLTPTEVGAMLETLRRVQATRGLTLLVIEHVMRALMQLAHRIVVLHHGELIAQGDPARSRSDRKCCGLPG